MAKSMLSFSMVTLVALALAASVAHAQDALSEPNPAPPVPAVATPTLESATPTLESLQAELRQLGLRHEDELKALSAQLAKQEEESALAREREALERERLLRVYGFADVGMMRTIPPDEGELASQFTVPLSFYLGRVNLYFDAQPAQDFRFLAEARLSLYPNGTRAGVSDSGQVFYTPTVVNDVASPNPTDTVSWGSVILERAALDWTRYPWFSVRTGLFLTPFGVYNVDHGSPTLITITLPIYIGQGWIPVRQTGIQIFGSFPVERWELGYALTASNGRSEGVLDVDDSKAFGGRMFAKRQGALRLLLGASALYQPYRRNRDEFGVDAAGRTTFTRTREVERTMLTLGLDQSLDYEGLRIRNELVLFRTEYSPGKREMPPQARGGYAPDNWQYNWALVVAYRYRLLEPYVRWDMFLSSPAYQYGHTYAMGPGLNLYLRPNVIVKAAWGIVRFFKDDDPQNLADRGNFHTFNALLTWAF